MRRSPNEYQSGRCSVLPDDLKLKILLCKSSAHPQERKLANIARNSNAMVHLGALETELMFHSRQNRPYVPC